MKIAYKATQISYTISGVGPVIVWLHGFLESKAIWEAQCAFFDAYFTNICIDLLGHGDTQALEEDSSIELQAEAVVAIIKGLGIKNFSVIGHSMGGYVGLALLEKYKAKISHFVLLHSTSYPDSLEKQQNRDRAIKLIATQKNNFIHMGIVNLFSSRNRNQFSKEIDDLISRAQQITPNSIIIAIRGMKVRPSRTNILINYTGKKLIVAGEQDPVILLKKSKEEAIETKSHLLILESGHMSYIENPIALNNGLLEFLKAKN